MCDVWSALISCGDSERAEVSLSDGDVGDVGEGDGEDGDGDGDGAGAGAGCTAGFDETGILS